MAYRIIQLRDLIVLRIIWIKIVFTIELAILINLTISCQSNCHCILNNLLV